jgi:hypothetical protein
VSLIPGLPLVPVGCHICFVGRIHHIIFASHIEDDRGGTTIEIPLELSLYLSISSANTIEHSFKTDYAPDRETGKQASKQASKQPKRREQDDLQRHSDKDHRYCDSVAVRPQHYHPHSTSLAQTSYSLSSASTSLSTPPRSSNLRITACKNVSPSSSTPASSASKTASRHLRMTCVRHCDKRSAPFCRVMSAPFVSLQA